MGDANQAREQALEIANELTSLEEQFRKVCFDDEDGRTGEELPSPNLDMWRGRAATRLDEARALLQGIRREGRQLARAAGQLARAAKSRAQRLLLPATWPTSTEVGGVGEGGTAIMAGGNKEQNPGDRPDRAEPEKDAGEPNRGDLSHLCVRAAILLFGYEMWNIRNLVPEGGADGAGVLSTSAEDIAQQIERLEDNLAGCSVRHSAVNYSWIANDLRQWADRLSPEASGHRVWVAIAPEVVRELRYHAHRYRTKHIWALVRERTRERDAAAYVRRQNRRHTRQAPEARERLANNLQQGVRPWLRAQWRSVKRWWLIKRVEMLAFAMVRTLYEGLFGYGFRARRFVFWAATIILLFAVLYSQIVTSRCPPKSYLGGFDYVEMSLSNFTTLGNVSLEYCKNVQATIQGAASYESLIGYVMLGVLIAVFWTSLHEFDTRVSGLRLKVRRDRVSKEQGPAAGPTADQAES